VVLTCLDSLIVSIKMRVHSLDNGLFPDLYLLTMKYNEALLITVAECSVLYL
jgi:hypothetical protein